ncbi:hypothetical protein EON65_41760 [archaeon]|nr:MAG: hypothetical protein EON65_41760 [archaeon]
MATPLSTFQTPSKRIQLTLEDLGTASLASAPSTPFSTPNIPYNASSSSRSLAGAAGESVDYKQELAKLMMRSKGTPYEKTLKKFVESKLSEMERHEVERQNELNMLRVDPESEEITLLNLSPRHKFDSSQTQSNNLYAFQPYTHTAQSNNQHRLEEISRPLERNKYKGPEIMYARLSTNHIGRQRPPPKLGEEGDRDGYTHTGSNGSLGGNWSVPKASIGFSKVSTRDFQDWLKSNEKWAEQTERKVGYVVWIF